MMTTQIKNSVKGQMKYFIILAFLFMSSNLSAITVKPSNRAHKLFDAKDYSWMLAKEKSRLFIAVTDSVEGFLSEEQIEKYFKLKMRNFVRDVKFSSDDSGHGLFFSLTVELYKYNKKLSIYYGEVAFKVEWLNPHFENAQPYIITTPLAGSERQIAAEIKKEIDSIVELYASDYYYMEDLMEERKKKYSQSSK